jgi:hypothetical protein
LREAFTAISVVAVDGVAEVVPLLSVSVPLVGVMVALETVVTVPTVVTVARVCAEAIATVALRLAAVGCTTVTVLLELVGDVMRRPELSTCRAACWPVERVGSVVLNTPPMRSDLAAAPPAATLPCVLEVLVAMVVRDALPDVWLAAVACVPLFVAMVVREALPPVCRAAVEAPVVFVAIVAKLLLPVTWLADVAPPAGRAELVTATLGPLEADVPLKG